jgi:hypothetical protein
VEKADILDELAEILMNARIHGNGDTVELVYLQKLLGNAGKDLRIHPDG